MSGIKWNAIIYVKQVKEDKYPELSINQLTTIIKGKLSHQVTKAIQKLH